VASVVCRQVSPFLPPRTRKKKVATLDDHTNNDDDFGLGVQLVKLDDGIRHCRRGDGERDEVISFVRNWSR
jgi:DNA-binding helix-hairpin-helix protein with protein kinase domain